MSQCGWGVFAFDERPLPDDARCRACHRCVTYCPSHAITVKRSVLAYGGNRSWAAPLRRAIWRQAETGGVMLASTGNDGPYLSIFDHLVLDACQITNPSIDPLREPMELRTYLGGQPDAVAVEPDDAGGYRLKAGAAANVGAGQRHQARHADHLLGHELRLGLAQRAQVAGHGGRALRHRDELRRGRPARRPAPLQGPRDRAGGVGALRRRPRLPEARRRGRDQDRAGRQARQSAATCPARRPAATWPPRA